MQALGELNLPLV